MLTLIIGGKADAKGKARVPAPTVRGKFLYVCVLCLALTHHTGSSVPPAPSTKAAPPAVVNKSETPAKKVPRKKANSVAAVLAQKKPGTKVSPTHGKLVKSLFAIDAAPPQEYDNSRQVRC